LWIAGYMLADRTPRKRNPEFHAETRSAQRKTGSSGADSRRIRPHLQHRSVETFQARLAPRMATRIIVTLRTLRFLLCVSA
jgi:hypothetical protein